MHRLQALCTYIDGCFDGLEKTQARSFVYAHIHAVTMLSVQIARKRGLDAELLAAAARLHDVHTLLTLESENHGPKGAALAEAILQEQGGWSAAEIAAICGAIACHSEKERNHDPLTDALIDADVLEHCLQRFPGPLIAKEEARWAKLQKEFGL